MNGATAFVLVGGQSSRMGSDKALLVWRGQTLLQRALTTARLACGQAIICGPRTLYGHFGETLEDAQPGRGPLSGIQAALHATQTELNLVLSVDLPLLRAEFLQWLLGEARSGEQMITVPEAIGMLQPLCAVYKRDVSGAVDAAIAQGDLKVTRLFRRTTTRIITESEIRAAEFDPSNFTNVNTPEEYAALMRSGSARSAGEQQA